jgi:hypothetical protein
MKTGKMGLWVTVLGALCLVASGASAASKGKSVLAGAWEYDAGQSTFTGRPAYKSAKIVVTAVKGASKFVGDFTLADGKTVHTEYTGAADGSDIAVSGSQAFDSVTLLEPDSHTFIRTERRAGKVVGTTIATVAKDGKSFTATGRGTMPDGHQYTFSSVWKRVKK